MNGRDDSFAQEMLWKMDFGSSSTADNHSVNATDLARVSNAVPNLGSRFTNLVKLSVDDVDASHAATAKAEKEVELKKSLVSIAEKEANNSKNDVSSFRG